MSSRDRRQFPRLEGSFKVDLLNMGDDPLFSPFEVIIPGEALDVSKHGMRLKADYNVSVATLVSVVIYYKDRESVCLSEVVWKRGETGNFLYGLFFREWSQLDPKLSKALAQMEENGDAQSGPPPTAGVVPSPGIA